MVEKEKLYILPGFSIKNKDWAENTKKELEPRLSTEVIYWKHWVTGKPEQDWLHKEALKIKDQVGESSVSIIAKSIGTAISSILLSQNTNIDKLVLCGIPINDLLPDTANFYQSLKNFSPSKFLAFQNTNDPHGTSAQIRTFLNSLNPSLRLIEKQSADHEYPYASDFLEFLQ